MRRSRTRSIVDIYHVVARGTGHQIIFEDASDHDEFLRLLCMEAKNKGIVLHAWCLMSNHVHLLIHAPLDAVAPFMKRLLAKYAMYFNKKSGRVGHLFQGRYLSEPINDDTYLMAVIRYIHQNPVKAKIAAVDEYKWSSYREYLSGSGICDVAFPMGIFGEVEEFVKFHEFVPGNEDFLDFHKMRVFNMPDEKANVLAREVLGGISLDTLKKIPVAERNELIVLLRQAGFSVRQIARLTGIGRGVIQRLG